MYLKRLEIVGFKSFADRVEIEFVPGVTAVVGPNGSGKSNITDAIRWVLGEQSAKSLRGAKMEDIIFAGSETRKPLNYAEVTLILDNEDQFLPVDYQEVSVTRRVFRSGESEFLINKQPCRLRDIVDLFMDSGVGREAFSIISQGKVEEILNSKPEDRRTIFEEAAGVLKYKNRKKKAEEKLAETEGNLDRVSDIIFELQSQLEPLEKQASAAKDFLHKKEELERFEVALIAYEIEQLYDKWKTLSAHVEEQKNKEIELSAEIQAREAKIEEVRWKIQNLDEGINDLQDKLLLASEELEKLEARKEVLKERKRNAEQRKAQLEQTIRNLSVKIAELSAQKESQQDIVGRHEQEHAALRDSLSEKRKVLSQYSENINEQIEALKSDYIELLNQQAALKNELQNIEQRIAQNEHLAGKLEKENEKYLAERNNIEKKKAAVLEELAFVGEQLEEQIRLYRNEQQLLDEARNSLKKKERVLNELFQQLQKIKSRKDTLQEMEDEYAGFYQGVREVLKARNGTLSGIEGAVAELIQVPKEYERAIETALSGSMQHIVVDMEESARKAISYLKANGFGRATFLPLDVIKGKYLSDAQRAVITRHPSYIGIAAELIHYDRKYSNIMENLLGTVVIARDLRGANEMAKALHYRLRIVTVEGDVVNPGGSMTGGSYRVQTSSLLSRKNELEQLKKQLAEMEEKTSGLREEVQQLRNEIAVREQNLEKCRVKVEELRLKEQSVKGQLHETEIEEKAINERLSLYDLDKEQLKEELNNFAHKRVELQEQLRHCGEKIQQLERDISMLNKRRETQKSSKEMLVEEIGELKVQIAAKTEQLSHAKEKLQTLIGELEEHKKRKSCEEEHLRALIRDIDGHLSEEARLEEDIKEKLGNKNVLMERISSLRAERLQLYTGIEDDELEVKGLKKQHKELSSDLKADEVQLNRLDVELENLLAHLREEYLLTFEGAKAEYPLTVSPEEAREKVESLKFAIEAMGTVNLGAIEEYERVSQRYEFLLKQKEDLEQAKETLYKVIKEMDEEVKKRFAGTFDGVRHHFCHVFQVLFGGGKADLRLTEPDDLLNTGIDIVAQPPGKKLQNLGLLSGGERALTAIALLFSILKVRPVPFCILDEVEAALDEANVVRFSQYLKNCSEETQFIVITHRKGTMEEADVLYGVTMQESGVSKLVSVRLEDSNEFVQQL